MTDKPDDPSLPPVFLQPSEIAYYNKRGCIIDGRFEGHKVIEVKPIPSEEDAAKYLRLKSIHLAAIEMLAMKGDDRPQ